MLNIQALQLSYLLMDMNIRIWGNWHHPLRAYISVKWKKYIRLI